MFPFPLLRPKALAHARYFAGPPVTEVRAYIYEILMSLVETHAQVSSIATVLLERTMNALVEELTKEALTCFRQIRRFGMGGMLRVSARMGAIHYAADCSVLCVKGDPGDRVHSPNPCPICHTNGQHNTD